MFNINLKKLTLLLSASAFAALLVIPVGASAAPRGVGDGDECDYAKTETVSQGVDTVPGNGNGGQQVYVYVGNGTTGAADAAVGVCVDLDGAGTVPLPPGDPTVFDGGTAEAGVGEPLTPDSSPTGAYLVADGDDDNDDPATGDDASRGYIGVSNFETGTKESSCPNTGAGPNPETGTNTNSGDCLTVRVGTLTLAAFPVPLLMCGNDSSTGSPPNPANPDRRWENSTRDGCTLPQ